MILKSSINTNAFAEHLIGQIPLLLIEAPIQRMQSIKRKAGVLEGPRCLVHRAPIRFHLIAELTEIHGRITETS